MASNDLYGGMSKEAELFLDSIYSSGSLKSLYDEVKKAEEDEDAFRASRNKQTRDIAKSIKNKDYLKDS